MEYDPKDVLKNPSATEEKPSDSVEVSADMPSREELAELFTPDLSETTFHIADRTFKLRFSTIKTQKRMVTALDKITELLKKIDIVSIYEEWESSVPEEGGAEEGASFAKLIETIVDRGGISTILETLMNMVLDVVCASLAAQDDTVTRDWVEENIGFAQAQALFFMQLEKDRISGRVIDFLQRATLAVIG